MDAAPSHNAENTDLVELTVGKAANGGEFVARHDGRVVFVADVLEGERVLARVSDRTHDRFWRAQALRVLEASAHRVEHIWSAASLERDPARRAGGAEYGHIALDHQRRLKSRLIAETFQRFAGVDVTALVVGDAHDFVEPAAPTCWRTRVRVYPDAAGRLGPYAARTHTVVPVDDHPLATDEIEALLSELGPVEARHVDLVDTGSQTVAALTVHGEETRAHPLQQVVGDAQYTVDARGFWQVHREAASILSQAVTEAAAGGDPDAENLDLYGGVGLLAGALAGALGHDARITSVEADTTGHRHAADNLARLPRARTVRARTDRYLAGLLRSGARLRSRLAAATVVLDPPRTGAGKRVIAALTDLGVGRIVYVSCDPVTLARDVGQARRRGYELRSLRAFDLFAQTHHVEALAVLEPAE